MTSGEQANPEVDAEVKTLRRLVAELQLELPERKQSQEVLDRFFTDSLDMLCIADFEAISSASILPGNERLDSQPMSSAAVHSWILFIRMIVRSPSQR
jgi:hypothetical protein